MLWSPPLPMVMALEGGQDKTLEAGSGGWGSGGWGSGEVGMGAGEWSKTPRRWEGLKQRRAESFI